MPDLDPIFKAYDIRGTVPDQLDDALARAIGVGFAAIRQGGRNRRGPGRHRAGGP